MSLTQKSLTFLIYFPVCDCFLFLRSCSLSIVCMEVELLILGEFWVICKFSGSRHKGIKKLDASDLSVFTQSAEIRD